MKAGRGGATPSPAGGVPRGLAQGGSTNTTAWTGPLSPVAEQHRRTPLAAPRETHEVTASTDNAAAQRRAQLDQLRSRRAAPVSAAEVLAQSTPATPSERVKRVAAARSVASPNISPPRRTQPIAGLNVTPVRAVGGLGFERASATPSVEETAVGMLQQALSTRESAANQVIAEKEAQITQQGRELAELQGASEEMHEHHTVQVQAMENRIGALQRQLQKALSTDSLASPAKGATEFQAELRSATSRAEKAEREIDCLSEALQGTSALLHSVQDDLNQERLERARLVSSTRLEVRKELEQAHLDIMEEQRECYETELNERAEAHARLEEKLSLDLDNLKAEYATIEQEREHASREHHASSTELQRLRTSIQTAAQHADEAERLRIESTLHDASIAELRSQNKRMQNREGGLEARIVELELAAGLAQEEAAGEERMKAAAELEALQTRHRAQSKRDAEELGKLRGMLSAAEAKLELSDEVARMMESKAEALQRQLMDKVTANSVVSTESIAHQHERAEHKVLQLEKNLAENRTLLGRQAGQLQASAERTTGLEARLQDTQERMHTLERDNATLTAENSEARVTLEMQAAELHKSRFSQDSTDNQLDSSNLKVQELVVELRQLTDSMETTKVQLKQAEDRAHGLEAALASQASTLRMQLQVDAESQCALKLTRERTAWESSSMEMDMQLQVACRRRMHQARVASGCVERSQALVTMATGLKQMQVYASQRRLVYSQQEQRRLEDEMESVQRRELALIEELDELRSEHVASVRRPHASPQEALARRTQRELELVRRWSGGLQTFKCYTKWLSWTEEKRRIATRLGFSAIAIKSVMNRSKLLLISCYYSRWMQLMYNRSHARFSHSKRTSAGLLQTSCRNATRSVALRKWSSFVMHSMRQTNLDNRRRRFATMAVLMYQKGNSFLVGAMYAKWLRWWQKTHQAKRQEEETRVTVEELERLTTRVATLQGQVATADSACNIVAQKREQMKPLFATLLLERLNVAHISVFFSAWWRWLCYKGLQEEQEGQELLRKQTLKDAAAAAGARKEMEDSLDELVTSHTELAESHKDATDELCLTRERCNILEKGLAQARLTFTIDMEKLSNSNVELESKCETLSSELKYTVEELEIIKEQAENGFSETRSRAQSETHMLQEELTLIKATLASAETQHRKDEDEVRQTRGEVTQLQTQLKDSEDRLMSTLEELRVMNNNHDEELRVPLERVTSLEVTLSESKGNIRELENQVLGRTAEQRRLSIELEEASAGLARETEKRITLERALSEVSDTCAKQAEELVAQVMQLDTQLSTTTTENTALKGTNEELEMEIAEMRGRVEQVDKMRQRMGQYSEFKNTPEISEELMQLKEENQHREEELSVAAKKIIDAERKVSVMRGKVEVQKNRISEQDALLDDMASRLEDSGETRRELDEKEQENIQLQNLLRALRTEADGYNEEYERRGNELKEMETEMEGMRERIAAFELRAGTAGSGALDADTAHTSPQHNPDTPHLRDAAASPVFTDGEVSQDPPSPASPPAEPSESAPPVSPPSPFGRKRAAQQQQRPPVHTPPPSLTPTELQRLEWIFHYGDRDADGFLNFAELRSLSNDTAGGLDREQYESILEVLGAPTEGLRVEHLRRLYVELGSPGDIDDNYDTLQFLQGKRLQEHPVEVPILGHDPTSPTRVRSHTSSPSESGLLSPRTGNRSPSASMMSMSSLRRTAFPYGTSGVPPFRVQNSSKADPDPIVVVAASQLKALPRGALIVEVANRTTGEVKSIASREQFVFAVSEQSGAFEGTKLTLKFVKEPSAIRQWRDQLRANQVRKGRRVYPSMSKTLIEEVTLTVGPMTEDGREVRKQAIMKRATQLTPSPEVNVDVLYQLVHTPDVLKSVVEAKLATRLEGCRGALALNIIYSELHAMCGVPAPPVEEFDALLVGESFHDMWQSCRAGYLRAYFVGDAEKDTLGSSK